MELVVLVIKWLAAAAVITAVLKVVFMRLNTGVALGLAASAVAIAVVGSLALPLLEQIDDAVPSLMVAAEPALVLAAPSTTVDGEVARAIPAGKNIDRVWSPDGAPRMIGIYHANDSAWIPYRTMCAQRLDDPKHSLAGEGDVVAYEYWRFLRYEELVYGDDSLTVLVYFGSLETTSEVSLIPVRTVTKDGGPAVGWRECYGAPQGCSLAVCSADRKDWLVPQDVQPMHYRNEWGSRVTVWKVSFHDLKSGQYLMIAEASSTDADPVVLQCAFRMSSPE